MAPDVSSRCLAGVCALTTRQGSTVRGVLRSTTTDPGGLPTVAAGSRTRVRVSDHLPSMDAEVSLKQLITILFYITRLFSYCLL